VEGKHAVKWMRLSCTTFRANAVRLLLHVLAYNLANLLCTLALPGEVAQRSLVSSGWRSRASRHRRRGRSGKAVSARSHELDR
jgi:hypothetical protein